jgi:hypothetical protein
MIDQINFSQVLQASVDGLRYSIDGTKTFIKYETTIIEEDRSLIIVNPETGEEETIQIKAGIYGRPDIWSPDLPEYTHSEMLDLLATAEWSNSTPEQLNQPL